MHGAGKAAFGEVQRGPGLGSGAQGMHRLAYCLGGEIVSKMPEEALAHSWHIILDVLFLPQFKNFWAYGLTGGQVDAPAEFCWLDDIDRWETWAGDSDAGDRDSDWEEIDDPDEYYDDEDDPMEGLLRSVLCPPCAAALPTDRPMPPGDCSELPYKWYQRIQAFFYPQVDPVSFTPLLRRPLTNFLLQKGPRSKKDVVDDLKEMRNLKPRNYLLPRRSERILNLTNLT
ncbi:hypothetical protein B0H10DRAFT_2077024 [Mycena sp. CBHHK59/15]|nr:hypothetical protein B0H10DRAFT_2077024 [Mycena sp. CBHHK59/15]